MKEYLSILEQALDSPEREGRNGKVRSLFNIDMSIDMAEGFPLLTTKKLHFKSIAYELLFFLKTPAMQNANARYLEDNNVKIWRDWYPTEEEYSSLENRKVIEVERKPTPEYVPLIKRKNCGYTSEYKTTWTLMLDRCYNPKSINYVRYGAKGIFVSERWHDLKLFSEDLATLPNYRYKVEKPERYQLDKDYYGASYYSKESCVWLDRGENSTYASNVSPLEVIHSDNSKVIYLSESIAIRSLEIAGTTMRRWIDKGVAGIDFIVRKSNSRFVGYEFKRIKDDKLYRYDIDDSLNLGPIYGSQWMRRLPQVIEAIKHDPTSRRLCVSSWQEDCIDTMALPPCHLYFQFYCSDPNILDLSFTMRSTDVFLGLPYNIASYALLLNIVAKMTGRIPGKLHVHLNDVHLYENHVKMAKEQLSREPSKLPSLDVLTKRLSIDRYEYEDFKLWDYNAQAHIKAEVSK